jgi:hypothetical protein
MRGPVPIVTPETARESARHAARPIAPGSRGHGPPAGPRVAPADDARPMTIGPTANATTKEDEYVLIYG